jgi:hypothetical protein
MWTYLSRAIRAGVFNERCNDIFLDSGTPVDPSGGCCGWEMAVRVNVGSYPEPT